jgi:hypothetical protein
MCLPGMMCMCLVFFWGGGLLVKGLGRADWSAVSVMVAH